MRAMQITEILLEPATITAITSIGAAVSISRSIIVFQNSSGALAKSLRKLERRIERVSEGLPETRERVLRLEVGMGPLRDRIKMFNLYFDRINEVWTAAEMKEARQEQKEEVTGRSSVEAPEKGRRPGGKA